MSTMTMTETLALVPRTPTKPKAKARKHNTPHLPKNFLQHLLRETAMDSFQSWVFSDEMRKIRLECVDVNTEEPRDPNAVIVLDSSPSTDDPMYGTGRTLLHHAVVSSDHLLVYEMIR